MPFFRLNPVVGNQMFSYGRLVVKNMLNNGHQIVQQTVSYIYFLGEGLIHQFQNHILEC